MGQIAAIVTASATRNSQALNNYVNNLKEGQTGDRFVAASGINGTLVEFAEQQRRDNRKRWKKDATRRVQVRWGTDAAGHPIYRSVTEGAYVQGYHVVQSFARDGAGSLNPDDPADVESAHQLGRALANRLAGITRGATIHTQIDGKTGCLHNHIIIDSVCSQTGRSFDSKNTHHKALAATHDAVLLAEGYEQVNVRAKSAWEAKERSEDKGLARHQEWESTGRKGVEPFSFAILKQRVKDAQAEGYADWDDYVRVCRGHGVDVEQRGKNRGISYMMLRRNENGEYVTSAPSDRRRARKVGRFAMMDAVEEGMQGSVGYGRKKQPVPGGSTGQMVAAMADVDAELAEQRAYSAAALLESWASERRTREMLAGALRAEVEVSDETVEETTIDPRMALTEQVCLNAEELRRWQVRSPDRYEMWQRGMTDEDVEDAIRAWYDLDQPETAWEREREASTNAPATAGTVPGSAPATAVSSPETGPPHADPVVEEQVAETVTKETAEPETTVPVETPRVVEEPAEPQAEVRAPAAAGSTPDPAPASAGTGPEVSPTPGERDVTPYRSRVRSRKPTREREVPAWQQMVAIDERWQAQLADGQAVDGGLVKGLRTSTLARYEEDLDPAVAYELWRRAAKLAEAKRAREVQQNEELAAAMRAEVDAGDLAWSGEPGTLEELKMAATRGLTSREKAIQMLHEPVLETRHEDGELER